MIHGSSKLGTFNRVDLRLVLLFVLFSTVMGLAGCASIGMESSGGAWIVKSAYFSAIRVEGRPDLREAELPPAQKQFDPERDQVMFFCVVFNNPRRDFVVRGVLVDPDGLEAETFEYTMRPEGRGTWAWYWRTLPLFSMASGEWTVILFVDGKRAGAYSAMVENSRGSESSARIRPGGPVTQAAWSAYRQGNYRRALELAERAATSASADGGQRTAIGNLYGLIQWKLGDFPKALASLDEALRSARAQGDERGLAEVYLNLALVHQTMGSLQSAGELLDQGLPHFKASGHEDYAGALLRAGKIRLDLNRLGEAESLFDEAREAARPRREQVWSRALLGLAEVKRRRGDRHEAWVEISGSGNSSEALEARGWWSLDEEMYDSAAQFFQQAYEVEGGLGQARGRFSAAAGLVRVELARGNLAKAQDHVSRLEGQMRQFGLTSDTWRFWFLKGLFHDRSEDREAALIALKEAARHVELLRGRLQVDELRATYAADKQELYESLIRVAVRLGRHRDAFDTIERAKTRAFVDLLAQRQSRAPGTAAVSQLTKYEELDQTQRALEAEVLALQVGIPDRPVDDEVVRKAHALRSVAEERKKVAGQLVAGKARMLEITAQPTSVDELLRRMPPGTVLLDYYLSSRTAAVGILRAGSVEVIEIEPVKPEELLTFARLAADAASTGWEPVAAGLYRRLIGPFADRLEAADTLIISPHGAAHYVPFQALLLADGRFVGARWAISYLPSASVLAYLPEAPSSARRRVLGVANPTVPNTMPLPGAEMEVRGIAELFPTRVLAGDGAIKQDVLAQSPTHSILHFATHGQLDAQRPMQSSLRLTPAGDDDGRLTVDEIFNLVLQAELVVLSACNTGINAAVTGEAVAPGDELVGLSRAFLYAGARSLVVSLWPVADDATASLMTEFYRNLRQMPKARALQQAQIALFERGRSAGVRRDVKVDVRPAATSRETRLAHPFYWAAFVLVGDGQ